MASFFNSLVSVWISDEALLLVYDILHLNRLANNLGLINIHECDEGLTLRVMFHFFFVNFTRDVSFFITRVSID